ncbi:11800_t:CDS:10 [Entrophospora sp. SA101]|nr:11800_t:CDS:10 [Entrophospora sp. SA101]
MLSCNVESRLIDGSDNNSKDPDSGTPNQNFHQKYPPEPFFGPDGDSMIKTPSDVVDIDPKQPVPKCTDPLPADTYPMPRCISNIITNYHLDQFDIKKTMSYRSKRQTKSKVPSDHKLYIPYDDATYNPATSLPGQLSNLKSLAFNRSNFLPPTTQKPKRTGYNTVTPFLDLGPIYGVNAEGAKDRREGNRGKLKTNGDVANPYPYKDSFVGNIFITAIQTIWLREHNRLCDQFYEINGDAWSDDKYFEEARKWNIAFYQKVVTEEYLGVVMGRPLPPYQKYDPDLTPGIDVFFATITFRYGHSELSDFYRIQDEYGDAVVELSLQDTFNKSLLEEYGAANLLRSMSLQRQEDVDIHYSDASRNVKAPDPTDLVAIDVLRARDRGIALYNDVRQAYGLEKKDSWADITSVKETQDYLQQLYPNGTNQLEALVGAMAEDHLSGSNFGELMNTSMITQNNLFTDEDRVTLRNTTFRDIIIRNLDDISRPSIPLNIWSVQPTQKLSQSSKYLNRIALWPTSYVVSYDIVEKNINFQVQILTTDGNAWFGMGFDPDDTGMTGADFVIGIISNGNVSLSNYRSAPTGYNPPIKDDDHSDLTIINDPPPIVNNFATIEFSRPLVPNGRKGIRSGPMKFVLAYNPGSSVLSYHQNNRQMTLYDFYNNKFSPSISNGQRLAKLAHGLGMFLTWWYDIDIKYIYIKIHRFIQLLGGICICGFGATALATISPITNHSVVGLTIYSLLFIELGLGLISIWGQVAIVSVNQGYPRFLKRIHRFFGISLLMCAWANVYLGIETYCLSYGFESLYYRIAYLIWIKDLDKLPEFTWREVNERVQRGAYLVVCDGFVVSMRKWIKVHPGGAKILERVIGTDITNDFFGYKGDEIIEHIIVPEIKTVPTGMSTSVLGQYTNILHERIKKYTTQRNSLAQIVDDMNVKYFLKAPLAIHPHSLFAIKKIARMIVAKLKENPDVVESPTAPIFGPKILNINNEEGGLNDEEIAKQDTVFRIKFRRYKLTSKAPINGRHYIEVQSRIKGQVVIRSYTPIEGSIAQSFSIFVKVYPDGLMSRHLNGQLKGYEIQVRGPFDVGDREIFQSPLLSQTVDATSQYRRSSIYAKSIPPFISSSTSSLLNPNTRDGHWKELYMICGGTGITPMLQLITYHLELCMRRSQASTMRNKRVSMHLLYGNHKIEDIINGVELEEYRLSSRGMLTITYALNEPTQVWTGKNGDIDQKMISDWLTDSPSTKKRLPYVGSIMTNMMQFKNNNNTTNTTYLPVSTSPLQLNNTNTTNSSISKSPPQLHNPLLYDDNNNNSPPIIPLHTKPRKPSLPPIMVNNNDQNTSYRSSINPESALSPNYQHYRTPLLSSPPPQQASSSDPSDDIIVKVELKEKKINGIFDGTLVFELIRTKPTNSAKK